MKPTIGIVVALPAEARALAGRTRWRPINNGMFHHLRERDNIAFSFVQAGIGYERSLSASKWLVAEGAKLLASVGVAGGLSPKVNTGDLITAEKVVEQSGGKDILSWTADPAYAEAVYQAIGHADLPVHCGMLATSRHAVLDVAYKRHLYSQTKALAVDMESAAIATVSQAARLPFFALRSVSDSASTPVSKDIYTSLRENGRVKFALLLGRVLQKPALATELPRLKKDFDAALFSLAMGWQHAQEILTAMLNNPSL